MTAQAAWVLTPEGATLLAGLGGALIGGAAAIAGSLIAAYMQRASEERRERARRAVVATALLTECDVILAWANRGRAIMGPLGDVLTTPIHDSIPALAAALTPEVLSATTVMLYAVHGIKWMRGTPDASEGQLESFDDVLRRLVGAINNEQRQLIAAGADVERAKEGVKYLEDAIKAATVASRTLLA